MKNLLFIASTMIFLNSFGQKKDDSFCKNFDSNNYFPLTIKHKKIFFGGYDYTESINQKVEIKGKEYIFTTRR